jgi:type I restriction enzyme S subunit
MRLNTSKYNQHWQDKLLNELGSFQRGKSRHRPRNDSALFVDGKHPLIQTGAIKEANLYITNHIAAYNDFGLAQSKLWAKDTLCITIAANIAETALLGYPMCFPDSVVGFNAYPSESSELFMHYVFTYIRRAIQNSATGSIQDNINIEYLTNLKFKIPDKNYQDKIVAILSALDLKIDCNNRINTELEAMAKIIYDYWFVQFDFPDVNGKPYKSSGGKMVYNEDLKREIPEGWEGNVIGNILSSDLGGTPSTKMREYWNGHIPWLNSGEIANFPIIEAEEHITSEAIEMSATSLMPKGTCVLSITRHLRPSILAVEACANQSVVGIYENDKLKAPFLYPYLKNEIPRLMSLRTGAQQPHINKGIVDESPIIVPSDEILSIYYEKVNGIYEQINNNAFQNKKLVELRDWLLPLLMNGQVTIKDI